MATKKAATGPVASALESIRKVAGAIAARIPFLPKRAASSPEPFSAIEDDTPLGDLLSASNAAPGMAPKGEAAAKFDFRALAESAVKNPQALAAIIVVLVFILALAVTAIVVATPPRATAVAAPFSEKGEALVKSWLPPPGDPLAARMVVEREGAPAYTATDAARLGMKISPLTLAKLREQSDAMIDDLYRTVP